MSLKFEISRENEARVEISTDKMGFGYGLFIETGFVKGFGSDEFEGRRAVVEIENGRGKDVFWSHEFSGVEFLKREKKRGAKLSTNAKK